MSWPYSDLLGNGLPPQVDLYEAMAENLHHRGPQDSKDKAGIWGDLRTGLIPVDECQWSDLIQ